MALFLVTGTSGVGKSTLVAEFESRGISAVDTDDTGLAHMYVKATGEPLTRFIPPEERYEGWIDDHAWLIVKAEFDALAARAQTETVFICGHTDDIENYYPLFAKVFCLIIDDQTLVDRVTSRTNNTQGKAPGELAGMLRHNSRIRAHAAERKLTIVDATQPTKIVADFILLNLKEERARDN